MAHECILETLHVSCTLEVANSAFFQTLKAESHLTLQAKWQLSSHVVAIFGTYAQFTILFHMQYEGHMSTQLLSMHRLCTGQADIRFHMCVP